MRLHGWCEACHKIKLVHVSSAGMVAMMGRGVPTGICADCEDKRLTRGQR
jgi:hypothetical protein